MYLRNSTLTVDDAVAFQKSNLPSQTAEEAEMRKSLFAVVLLAICSLAAAQQAMNNDAVIKLVKAGLSDDLIVSTINASPGSYDVSADGIIALKKAGATDKVITAIVAKVNDAPRSATAFANPADMPPSENNQPQGPSAAEPGPPQVPTPGAATQPSANKPRVYLQSESKGSQWNAARDQSMEMSKDFERDCPYVRVTISQNAADYTVVLNHIEHGFVRDNQFQVANRLGDLVSKTKEGGSIAGGVKKACQVILDDWAKTGAASR